MFVIGKSKKPCCFTGLKNHAATETRKKVGWIQFYLRSGFEKLMKSLHLKARRLF